MKSLVSCIALAGALVLGAGSAEAAGLFRAYLSSKGSDSNACTVPAPCRLLPAALAAVADGGEIWILDSANYNTGTVSITKSVTILAIPGAVGSFVSTGGGAAIAASTAGIHVTLRNVVIGPLAGGAAGTDGVDVSGAASFALEDSLIAGLAGSGIVVTTNADIRVARSTVRDNAQHGIVIGGGATGSIAGSTIMGNAMDGVLVQDPGTVATVSDSALIGNDIGLAVTSSTGGSMPHATIERSTVSDNATFGAKVLDSASVGYFILNNSMVTRNGTGAQGGPGPSTLAETTATSLVRQSISGNDFVSPTTVPKF
jgi:hypothetical protein